jgi:hypothetical protein
LRVSGRGCNLRQFFAAAVRKRSSTRRGTTADDDDGYDEWRKKIKRKVRR